MAEFIFKHKLQQAVSKWGNVDSAGTAGWRSGEGMHCGTADMLELHNIASNGFAVVKIRKQDLAI